MKPANKLTGAQQRALRAIADRCAEQVAAGKHAAFRHHHCEPCRTHELLQLCRLGLAEAEWAGWPGKVYRYVWLTDAGRAALNELAVSTIHVAPNGDDSNNGSAGAPLATGEAAMRLVAERYKNEETVEINFARGVYPKSSIFKGPL